MGTEKPLHGGHRVRVKRKFLKYGLSVFEEHEILELVLFYGIPQKDTNELAHILLNAFGSFDAVFDASYEELIKIPGIGENAAALIKLIPPLAKKYVEASLVEKKRIYNTKSAVEVLSPKFIGEKEEILVLMLLGSDGRLAYCREVHRGSLHEVPMYIRELTNLAINYKADTAIIAHNHPSGKALPSSGDMDSTKALMQALESIQVTLEDHIIFTKTDYCSMKNSGWLDALKE